MVVLGRTSSSSGVNETQSPNLNMPWSISTQFIILTKQPLFFFFEAIVHTITGWSSKRQIDIYFFTHFLLVQNSQRKFLNSRERVFTMSFHSVQVSSSRRCRECTFCFLITFAAKRITERRWKVRRCSAFSRPLIKHSIGKYNTIKSWSLNPE